MKICLKCSALIHLDDWRCLSCGWTPEIRNGFPILSPKLEMGTVDYPTESHDQLARIEESNFWFVNRNRLLNYLFTKYFSRAKSFCEIGCGTGFVLAGLAKNNPNMNFYGAEGYISGLLHAKKRLPKAKFIQFDACHNPFVEEFDVIGAFDVIEHIAGDGIVLRQMFNALKPNGGILITVPQHPWLWSNIDENAGHKRRYVRKELIEKIKAAGFDIQMITSFVTLLMPFMAVSRFMKNAKSKPKVELRLHRKVNGALNKICELECLLIKAGIFLPFGGSLVCVARKN